MDELNSDKPTVEMLEPGMTKFIIVALLTTLPALAQTAPIPTQPPTDRERVQADRAKAAEDEKVAPMTRPWDRDSDGKRPWERKSKP
ncbi:hypothetical protein GA0061098_1006243 [Bradyrhizobium shewense]|uniref:Uncharacterized protein n=1 Tax=Bradyrhizobium shewense TaxID=1761772 RepID=A0A1C3W3K2_9BRAD|nr:hypothetical protein [Bradyrhizobium shewense]SCB34478.1 hypothetical protein GA0061098_1006243 [Bradyrhizobium shewense]